MAKFQDGAKHCVCGRKGYELGLRIRGSRASVVPKVMLAIGTLGIQPALCR